jgi:spore coat protein A, manganese oxidase
MPAIAHTVPKLDPDTLAHFVDPLPLPLLAQPLDHRLAPGAPSTSPEQVPFYRVSMQAITTKLHRDLPPTTLWSYGGSVPGLTFETRSGQGVLVEWVNDLPTSHFLPIDHTLMGAEKDKPEVRGIVHLHGGKTPPESDGYPEDWYTPGQSRTYYYPNQQDPALLWYHDHTMGINRLNIYAGLLGLWIIRDSVEDALNLPQGKYEIPLVLMDRDLLPNGQLSYPVSADPERPWVPEAFGEAHLINGKLFPYLDVEPRKYRLRILNGANGRFYWLSFSPAAEMIQIGSDQGLLQSPVSVKHLHLAPAERADLIVDFAPYRGQQLTLQSEALTLMQFRVAATPTPDATPAPSLISPSQASPTPVSPNQAPSVPALAPVLVLPSLLRPAPRIPESTAVKIRRLTLDEQLNMVSESMGMLLNKTPWHAPITEKPVLNTTEIWELVNLTDDVHPIHLHMVRFQILDRRRFDSYEFITTGNLRYTSQPMPPEPNESGWKDTARVNAKTVTRIIIPFVGYAGRYVWHCHILEHEDNEMMRPYEVLLA